jgi:Flp pilus assembly protein TadD
MEVLFARITEAYNVLSEPGSRADYEALRAPVAPPTGSAPAPEPTVSQSPQELARLNYLRGKASVDQQKFVESLKFLENAVSLDPARPEYRLLLGLVQARNPHGRVEAIETLSMAARLDPTNVKVRMEIARLCRRGGDDVAAERWLREVLSIDPNHAEAREGLGENAGSGLLRGLFGRGERR